MKKLVVYACFSLVVSLVATFFLAPPASADVIPGGFHPVSRCIRIVNLDEFPDVVLIGYYTGPMVKYEAYRIKNNQCLDKGYKLNKFSVYWTTKEKFASLDLKNLKLTDITFLENLQPYGGNVDKSNPLKKEDIEYSIAGFSGGKLILYKSKQISEFNNGDPKKVETFDNPLGNRK